jgi:uncharacterized protein YjbJ (UPF0337 family)
MTHEEKTQKTQQDTVNTETAEKDQAAGGLQQAKGRLKESAGALTGNEHLKAEGEADQLAGKARNKKGEVKEGIKNIVDKA